MPNAFTTFNVDDVWVHNEEGYHAVITDIDFLTKDANDAAWQQGIMYKRPDRPDQRRYVRSTADFGTKFHLLES